MVMEVTSAIRGHSSHREGGGKQECELCRGEHDERMKEREWERERERRGNNKQWASFRHWRGSFLSSKSNKKFGN